MVELVYNDASCLRLIHQGANVRQNSPEFLHAVTVFHGPQFPGREILGKLRHINLVEVSSPSDTDHASNGILLLDKGLWKSGGAASKWRTGRLWPFLIIGEGGIDFCDFLVPEGWPDLFTLKALEGAIRELNLMLSRRNISEELDLEHEKLFQLTHIGLALSAERNGDKLLKKILAEGRHWACCDAASLFLVDRESTEPKLLFKLVQNDSVEFPFEEKTFTLDKKSLAGFVAVTGDILNLPDVYELPERAPFHFNSWFDESANYRTRSVLTVPMKNHQMEVIGVLQFINRKTSPDIRLNNLDVTLEHTLPFTDDVVILLKALASQAAVAISNSILVRQIQDLFEGFVSASVHAIEQRDPTTSGHSFRVADLTTTLAGVLPRSGNRRFTELSFDENQLREIRYASLLHDFGKVGVREPVLTKEKKLSGPEMEIIWHRFALYKEKVRNLSLQRRHDFLVQNGKAAYLEKLPLFEQELKARMDQLDVFYRHINRANEPAILEAEHPIYLAQVRDMDSVDIDGFTLKLLSSEEFMALSVRRGSLTPEERREIESHVVYTYDFLNKIPWTSELKRIPGFAVAHHEKLDGSGYPNGWQEEQIPLESKMMTVSDIYDALTASDRPYKKAMAHERALDILQAEAGKDLLDKDLVDIFIEAKVYEAINLQNDQNNPPVFESFDRDFFKRSVCDYDSETHGGVCQE